MALRFTGFDAGTAVSLSVTSGGDTRSAGVAAWGSTSGDTTPPTLSAASGASTGATSGTGTVTTNEAGGTLYWVCTISATAPSPAQIKAGQDHTGVPAASGGLQAVASSGQQSVAAAGLAASTTYRFHFLQTDAAGNDSTVASAAGFATDAAGGGTVNITLLRRSDQQMAPEAAYFRATVAGFDANDRSATSTAYDPSYHDLRYRWTVTRQGQGFTARATVKLKNLPAAHDDTNTGYGKEFGHVFTDPGTYVISCEVRDRSGTTGSASTQITVDDPASTAAGSATIVVAKDGNFSGAPAGANQVTSWGAAYSALDALSGAGRILLKRGESYAIGAERVDSGFGNFYVGAWGSGSDPVLQTSGTSDGFDVLGSFTGDFVLTDVDLQGPWDSTTEAGSHPGKGIDVSASANSKYVLLNNCDLSGFSQSILSMKDANALTLTALHDTVITNWADYGIFQPENSNGILIITASAIVQDENAMMGGDQMKNGISNQHGPLRIAGIGYVYVAASEFFSRNSWALQGGIANDQSCVRWNTGQDAGSHGTFERCVFEGGDGPFSTARSNSNSIPANVTNLLLDKCLVIGTATTSGLMGVQPNGVTVRNCIFLKPNRPYFAGDFNYMIDAEPAGGGSLSSPNDPVKIYNNTFVNLLSAANTGNNLDTLEGFAQFNSTAIANNVLAAPNWPAQQSEDPQLSFVTNMPVVGGSFDSRYLGVKYNNYGNGAQTSMDTSYATQAGILDTFEPLAGSPLIGSAAGETAIDDFYGVLRPAGASRGAVEP